MLAIFTVVLFGLSTVIFALTAAIYVLEGFALNAQAAKNAEIVQRIRDGERRRLPASEQVTKVLDSSV